MVSASSEHYPYRAASSTWAATTLVTGIEESAGRSSGDGGTSRASSSAPSAATMAPLSVHSPGLGTRSRIPAEAQRSAASARSRELAATPPPTIRSATPFCRQAATALAVSTSATDSWNDAATSLTGTAWPPARRASTQRATAVFSPAKEKSSVPSRYLPRGKATADGSPLAAAASIGGPPGNDSPSSRATLSYASPAASSMVAPSGTTSAATSGTSSSEECPPDTSRATAGAGSGPCSS